MYAVWVTIVQAQNFVLCQWNDDPRQLVETSLDSSHRDIKKVKLVFECHPYSSRPLPPR